MFSWITVLITYHFLKYLFPLSIILVLFSASRIIFESYFDFCSLSLLVKTFSYSAYGLSTFLLCKYDSINMVRLFPVRVQRIMHDLWGLEHLTAFTVSLPWFLEVEQFSRAVYQLKPKQTSRPSPLNVGIRSADCVSLPDLHWMSECVAFPINPKRDRISVKVISL